MIDEIDERRNEEGRPGYHSWEEAEAEADAMLARDWDGTRQRILDAGRRGEPLDDTWTAAAQKIYNAEYQAAIRSGDAKALEDVIQFGEAHRETGSAAGRSMAIRRDRIESPMERIARVLSLAITTPPERMRRKREALRKQGREAQKRGDAAGAKDAFTAADKINADWARKFAELKAKLKLLGVDLDNLNDLGYSKIKAAEALGHIARHKADRSDKFYEYWRNSILSAFTTQAANLLGNTGHSSWHFTAERFVEALVNLGVGDPMSAQFGEFKYLLGGVLPGLSRGARNFLLSWRLESPMLEYEIGREGQWKWEEPDTAIAGKKGKIIRWPQRLLLAADEFSKSLFTEMEAGAYAYRIAKMEGKKGDALRQRIAALVADTQSKAWDFAHESSLELTFQQKGGKVAQAVKTHVLSARRDLWGVRYLIPFVTTPTNIFATGIRKSPAGTPLLLWKLGEKMHANHKAGKSVFDGMNENVARPLAEQVIAWGLVLALMALTDPDDPILTGSTGEYNAADREVGYRTRPTQSVRLGDTWYSYSRLEPFATVLGLTIDWINAVRTGDPNEITDVPIDSLAGQLKNKTFLSGVGDILRALESEKSSEWFVQWLSSFGTSWVPNAARSISRESDDYYMNRRVWGREGEWKKRLGKRTLQKTELVGSVIRDYPIYDVWGRPAQRSEAPVGSDFLWRIIMPIRTQKADMFVADRAIINYNNQQPDDERFPRSPAPYYRKGDETVYMSDGQYADFALLAGQAAVAGLSGETVQINADNPTKAHVEWINDVTTKARSKVRELLVKRWAGEKVEIDPEAIGRDVADDALASLAWTAAESPQYTEEAQAAAGKLRDLGVDNRTLSSVLAWKKAKAGHKTSSIGAWQRRLFARLAQAKP